jgi:hypothetical protein
MARVHRVYLIPGMFGFGRLAGYDYFEHVRRELGARFDAAGERWGLEVVATPPTASIRRRARDHADTILESCGDDDGPIHLIGHSTGGLDARLLATPGVNLGYLKTSGAFRSRIASVVTMNCPHYGTPLAQFFATVSGTRLLYALSLLTVTTLTVGGPPLTAASSLLAAVGGIDAALGLDIRVLDRATEVLLRFLGEKGQSEVRAWLEGIRLDQGGIIQLTPEAMDLFNASADDAPGVRYGSVVSASPSPGPFQFASTVKTVYDALSGAIYGTIFAVTSRPHPHYPIPDAPSVMLETLRAGLGFLPEEHHCDGVVPTRSQLWGELLWCGPGDHLDVVGHFRDDHTPSVHTDWLSSGAVHDRRAFGAAMDAIARFLLGP